MEKQVIAWLAILLGCCVCTFGLDPSLDVSQYAHTAWKVRDGFARGAIASIAQTPDGYLWLGTEFGLFLFDGVRVTQWQPSPHQHLPQGPIFSLLVSRNGTLWIGAKGLASLKDGKLTAYPQLADQYVFALHEDREGDVWIGGSGIPSGTICAAHGSAINCFDDDNGWLRSGVYAFHEDRNGVLWAGVQDGLVRCKPSPVRFYSLPGEQNGIQGIAEDQDGALLVPWKGTIHRFNGGHLEDSPAMANLREIHARTMLRDRDGSLWIGTYTQGIVHVHQGRTDSFSLTDGLSGDQVAIGGIFEDREGSVWICTAQGLDRFRDLAVATFTPKQGLLNAYVGSVLADKEENVWLGTYEGLNRWNHGRITIPQTGSTKRDGTINGVHPNSMFRDNQGRLWLSTSRQFGYLENGRFVPIKGVPGGEILSIAQDTVGNLWLSNEHVGLFRVSLPNNVQRIQWSELGHQDHASVLVADRNRHGLWMGFFLGGISYLSDGHIRESYTAADGLGADRISDLQLDDDGSLWISTEGGLSRLKNTRLATLTSKNGLPCDTVHWAIRDDDYSMWLYTACGLVKIARPELDAWATAVDKGKNATPEIRVTVFDSSDGVRILSSPGHYHPQVAKTPDERIWFLPWDGVSVIDPHHLAFNKIPPPVHIEKITADDKSVDISNGMHLPTGLRNLDIDYTALSLVVPEKVRFRFKLEGQDKDWRELVNVRHVEYTNLPPKRYKFRVLACNNSGVWNEEGAALDFVIPPAWYQTNWFRGACIAAFLMMIWGIHELRVRQLAAQFNMRLEERVAERTRIARDLHDTLLQSFQGLLLEFQAVAYRLQPGEIKNAQEAAIRGASQAITEGRDTVQGLRASIREKNDLAEAIRAFGEELASSANNQPPVTFEVVVEGRRKRKRPFLRDEIYRIAIEALRNAFRHAQARRIEVELQYGDKAFTLRIRDNGRGIDRDVLSSDGRKGHFGLHGMRERAKMAGGELAIWSEVESGTEIELTIPASRAYTTSDRRFWWFRKSSQKDADVKDKVES